MPIQFAKNCALCFIGFAILLPGCEAGDILVITPTEIIPFSRYVQSDMPVAYARSKTALEPSPRSIKSLQTILRKMAFEYQVDPHFAEAILFAESAYNVSAVSPKGAIGLMQVMPSTGYRFGIHSLRDPVSNMTAGLRYLQFLNLHFRGDLHLVAAAYNAGEGAVERYGKQIPPFAETRQYVNRVIRRYNANLQQTQP